MLRLSASDGKPVRPEVPDLRDLLLLIHRIPAERLSPAGKSLLGFFAEVCSEPWLLANDIDTGNRRCLFPIAREEIAVFLGATPATARRHVAELIRGEFVFRIRTGREASYALSLDRLKEASGARHL